MLPIKVTKKPHTQKNVPLPPPFPSPSHVLYENSFHLSRHGGIGGGWHTKIRTSVIICTLLSVFKINRG